MGLDGIVRRIFETAQANLEEDGGVAPILFCLRDLDSALPTVLGLKVGEGDSYQAVLREATGFARRLGMSVLVAVSESWVVTLPPEDRDLPEEAVAAKYGGKLGRHPERLTCVVVTGTDGSRAVMMMAVYDETAAGYVKVGESVGGTGPGDGEAVTGPVVDILMGRS